MDVALIAPRSMLGFTQLGEVHFIIPVTVDEEFYANEKMFKIIDNGVYETGRPLGFDELLSLARKVKANEVIVPDVLFDHEKTYTNAQMFFDNYIHGEFGKMIVPQAMSPEGWIDAYFRMTKTFDEANCIGVPKWLDGKFHCRSAIMHYMRRHGIMADKPHHLLGVDSLADLITMPFEGIRSCDTSKPFTYAYAGKGLTFWEDEDIKRVDFDAPKCENIPLLMSNINVLREAAHWKDYFEV